MARRTLKSTTPDDPGAKAPRPEPRVEITNTTKAVLITGGHEEFSAFNAFDVRPYRHKGAVPLSLLREFVDAVSRHIPDATVIVSDDQLSASSKQDWTGV